MEHFYAVIARHFEITKDGLVGIVEEFCNRIISAMRDIREVPKLFRKYSDDFGDIRLIINDKRTFHELITLHDGGHHYTIKEKRNDVTLNVGAPG